MNAPQIVDLKTATSPATLREGLSEDLKVSDSLAERIVAAFTARIIAEVLANGSLTIIGFGRFRLLQTGKKGGASAGKVRLEFQASPMVLAAVAEAVSSGRGKLFTGGRSRNGSK